MTLKPEQDEWGPWPFSLGDKTLELVRAALEETPVIVEHRFYRGSRAPERLVFDEFDALAAYLRSKAHAGDASWMWRYSDLCLDENRLAWGKIPDAAGEAPKGSAY